MECGAESKWENKIKSHRMFHVGRCDSLLLMQHVTIEWMLRERRWQCDNAAPFRYHSWTPTGSELCRKCFIPNSTLWIAHLRCTAFTTRSSVSVRMVGWRHASQYRFTMYILFVCFAIFRILFRCKIFAPHSIVVNVRATVERMLCSADVGFLGVGIT